MRPKTIIDDDSDSDEDQEHLRQPHAESAAGTYCGGRHVHKARRLGPLQSPHLTPLNDTASMVELLAVCGRVFDCINQAVTTVCTYISVLVCRRGGFL